MSAPSTSRVGAQLATALASGALFGAGLVVSGMADPAKVIGFLDVGGAWAGGSRDFARGPGS